MADSSGDDGGGAKLVQTIGPWQIMFYGLGSMLGAGVYALIGKGAGVIKGVKLRGVPAWLAHRAYHGAAMPTFDRKWRIISGWLVDAVSRRDLSPMTALQDPRRAFREAAEATDREAAEKAEAKAEAGGAS